MAASSPWLYLRGSQLTCGAALAPSQEGAAGCPRRPKHCGLWLLPLQLSVGKGPRRAGSEEAPDTLVPVAAAGQEGKLSLQLQGQN